MLHAIALAAALAAGAPQAETPPAGDPRRGEALYVGAAALEHGGAPCLGCHTVGHHGLAWTAQFGPDLSSVAETYGADALASALGDVPFPSMAPLYARHPISEAERADLAAFLLAPHGPVRAASTADLLARAGALAALVLGASALLAWRTFRPVRRVLDARAAHPQGGTR
jgi:mono/diheme cytochrome c family protein